MIDKLIGLLIGGIIAALGAAYITHRALSHNSFESIQRNSERRKTCGICRTAFSEYDEIIILDCVHEFHKSCLNHIPGIKRCPYRECRSPIPPSILDDIKK